MGRPWIVLWVSFCFKLGEVTVCLDADWGAQAGRQARKCRCADLEQGEGQGPTRLRGRVWLQRCGAELIHSRLDSEGP